MPWHDAAGWYIDGASLERGSRWFWVNRPSPKKRHENFLLPYRPHCKSQFKMKQENPGLPLSCTKQLFEKKWCGFDFWIFPPMFLGPFRPSIEKKACRCCSGFGPEGHKKGQGCGQGWGRWESSKDQQVQGIWFGQDGNPEGCMANMWQAIPGLEWLHTGLKKQCGPCSMIQLPKTLGYVCSWFFGCVCVCHKLGMVSSIPKASQHFALPTLGNWSLTPQSSLCGEAHWQRQRGIWLRQRPDHLDEVRWRRSSMGNGSEESELFYVTWRGSMCR